jgi:S-DNA-T family DNA segregation ATPase FtsK/SpoIIIE
MTRPTDTTAPTDLTGEAAVSIPQPRPDDDHRAAEASNVVPFARPDRQPTAEADAPRAEVEPQVFEGEIVSDAESAALDRRLSLQRVRDVPVRVVRVIAASEHTARVKSLAAYRVRKAPRDLGRLTWFAIRGHGRWVAKAWTFVTYGDLRADARTARANGDAEARRAAQEAIRADARARWAKVAHTARLSAIVLAAVLILFVLPLVIADTFWARSEMWGWLAATFDVLDVASTVLGWLLALSPLGWLAAAVWEGRDLTPGAGWLVRPDRDDADSWIDERMISTALAHLGIGPLDKFFRSGGQLAYSVPARVDGDGTYAQVRLPMGVTAEMVAGQRKKLAANLGRAALETWPTEGDESGVLDLWVADKGKLAGGAGEWPLLHEGQADVFAGVPCGRSQRGEVIAPVLPESNWLIGGRPGQGKSAAMRTLLLGASLDPTAELQVFVMGESPDFEPFRPRLSRYAMGMDDTVAEQALQALRDALAEMERRGKVLGEQPGKPPKVSRKLADKPGLGLHPLVLAIDEVHELFQHKTHGAEAAELAVRLIKRGRKYGIILVLATQSPTKESIPREVTRNVSCGVAFAVADHVANDGLLGAGKYKAGIRATDLRMKTDRGTSVAVGVTDNVFELLRWFYVPFEDGADMVSPVITRAMQLIDDAGRTVAATAASGDDTAEVDFLADLATAIGEDKRVRTAVLLRRLVEINPGEYADWTFQDLKAALDDAGVPVRKSDGNSVVRTEDVTTAVTERDERAEPDSTADDPGNAGK